MDKYLGFRHLPIGRTFNISSPSPKNPKSSAFRKVVKTIIPKVPGTALTIPLEYIKQYLDPLGAWQLSLFVLTTLYFVNFPPSGKPHKKTDQKQQL